MGQKWQEPSVVNADKGFEAQVTAEMDYLLNVARAKFEGEKEEGRDPLMIEICDTILRLRDSIYYLFLAIVFGYEQPDL